MRRATAIHPFPERRLPAAFDATTEGFWETGPDHRYTQLATLSQAGDPGELLRAFDGAILGRTRWDLAGVDVVADPHWAAHKADLDARRPFKDFRYRLVAPSGRAWFLSVRGWPMFDPMGRFLGYRGTVTDESAIVAALERADAAEALLRDAVDSISEGFVLYDKDDRLVLANAAFARLYPEIADLMVPGARFEDIVRASIARGHYADVGDDPEAWVAERLRQHENGDAAEHRLCDGRWGLVTERRMRNGGTAGLRIDITRLKAAEAALRVREAELSRSQAHLTEAQRVGAIGSYERRIEGAGWTWSREMYHLFGRDPETFDITEANVMANVHPDDIARLLDERRRVVAEGGDPRELEFRIVRPDGTVRTVINRATSIRDDTGAVVGTFGTLQDVTERRHVERQLVQAQKMEAIGKLTGGVAHDFNNLLTVILGNAELLLTTLDGPDAELVRECALAARRGGALASQLLSFARRQVLRPTEIDVATLVPRTVTLMRRTLGANIGIDVHLRAEPFVVADPVQLESALLNLAINARDAMPDGGHIILEVDALTIDGAAAADRELAPGPYVAIALHDTGTGMAPEILAKVFEPFFTTKEVGKGSGLGLSMVYGFAKQSGGHVTITSVLGHGTTVRLWLPAVPRRAPPAVAPARTPASLPGGGETILVVEDSQLVRDMVVRQLRRLGYRVVEAVDGVAALAVLSSRPAEDPIDLIFTDVVMPGGLSGFDVAERARARVPGIRVLFTSGYSDDAGTAQDRFGPAARLLAKPYEPRELAHRLREILDAPR